MKKFINCCADYDNGFIGFYNGYESLLSSQIENEIEDYCAEGNTDLEFDDFTCDMEGFRKEVCEKWCEGLEELLGGECAVRYVGCWSPACYNYCSDEVRFELELDDKTIKEIIKFLKENGEVKDYIKEKWSDRVGFMSFISSDAKEWGNLIEEYVKSGEDKSKNNNIETHISLAVYYWLKFGKGKDARNYLLRTIYEEIDFGMFVKLNESGRMKVETGRSVFKGKDCGIPDEFQIEIEE